MQILAKSESEFNDQMQDMKHKNEEKIEIISESPTMIEIDKPWVQLNFPQFMPHATGESNEEEFMVQTSIIEPK